MPQLDPAPKAAFFRSLQLFFLIALGLGPAFARAEPLPLLVGDLSPGSHIPSFHVGTMVQVGDLLYFTANGDLWESDGTVAGSHRLDGFCPPDGCALSSPVAAGDIVVFSSGEDTLFGYHQGQVETLAHGLSFSGNFASLGPLLYFRSGNEIWRTDGTAGGTSRTSELCGSSPCSAPPERFTAAGGALYYLMNGSLFAYFGHGDRRQLGSFGYVEKITSLGGSRVIFTGCVNSVCSAWGSDGTSGGTRLLEPANGGSLAREPRNFVAWRGRMYFSNLGRQMVSTDGTPAGTRLEDSFSAIEPTPFAANDDFLLYTAKAAIGFSNLALRSRAADGSDRELKVAGSFQSQGSQARLGSKIFLVASLQLMATDGTLDGTVALGLEAFTQPGIPYRGLYYLGLDPNNAEGAGLWSSDGTPAGTRKLDLAEPALRHTLMRSYGIGASLVADIYFSSGEREDGLYRIDPQTFAISPVDQRDLALVAAGHTLIYAMHLDQANSTKLVAIGADSVVDLTSGGFSPQDAALAEDDRLYFTSSRPGQKLFETDGTPAGTRELFDQRPGHVPACSGTHCETSYPRALAPSGNRVFFIGESSDREGESLWVWQRGQTSPRELKRHDDPYSGAPIAMGGGKAVFEAPLEGGSPGLHLWQSDGSVAGTRAFFQLPAALGSTLAAGNLFFFQLEYPQIAMWVTDLTAAGTYPLLNGPGLELKDWIAAGDRIFFTGKPASGQELTLGVSDGTPAGTRWLDLELGPVGSAPGLFATGDQRVIFSAEDDETGSELWISDGSPAGTRRLTDIKPGAAGSSPQAFARVGQRLFFTASDGAVGLEPWALDLDWVRPPCPQDRLCFLDDRFEVAVAAHAPDGDFRGRRALGSRESGVFTYFSPNNWEIQVKVLDGCAINDTFWVFASAASDLGYTLKVKDRATGLERTFEGPTAPPRPIVDTAAFATCGLPSPATEPFLPPPGPPASLCQDDPATFCLGQNGRYRVRLDWNTASGQGQAQPMPYGSADSGLFTFFSPNNWEMMVKLLDGCALNSRRWVFAAGTTDVGWTMKVTDRNNGAEKVYTSQLGQPSKTVTDSEAFDCN
jgi:large repetitive protein